VDLVDLVSGALNVRKCPDCPLYFVLDLANRVRLLIGGMDAGLFEDALQTNEGEKLCNIRTDAGLKF
jgi:hypothetical protein